MKTSQLILHAPETAAADITASAGVEADLVLAFGATGYFTRPGFAEALREQFPKACLLGCSTAGEISGEGVTDGSCVLTTVRFESTRLRPCDTELNGMEDSQAAGERIGTALAASDLLAVIVFGPGVNINGSALVNGISSRVGDQVPISGGLAGDGGAFVRTSVLGGSGISDVRVAAIGLYGDGLSFAHGSFGGWQAFGPVRKVTRCVDNVLFELDGEPALAVYKRYLGDHARDLPASGLLFPFAMLGEDQEGLGLIRTILGVDESSGSLTLAGAINPDGYLKLMHASTDGLVNGAEIAAAAARNMHHGEGDSLAILVSCVGRKLVMGDRVDEEVEAVSEIFGAGATVTGFYSYGEISPFVHDGKCYLHNQTMTIAWLGEP